MTLLIFPRDARDYGGISHLLYACINHRETKADAFFLLHLVYKEKFYIKKKLFFLSNFYEKLADDSALKALKKYIQHDTWLTVHTSAFHPAWRLTSLKHVPQDACFLTSRMEQPSLSNSSKIETTVSLCPGLTQTRTFSSTSSENFPVVMASCRLAQESCKAPAK